MPRELIKTGIPGMDILLGGGILRNGAILISGSPGTGKTMACLQFLKHGIEKGENGIYITTEECQEDILFYSKNIGVDLDKYVNKKLFIVEKPVETLKGGIMSLKGLLTLINKNNVKRVVVDSLVFFEYLYDQNKVDDIEFRRKILIFLHKIKTSGCTIIATSERQITDLDHLEFDMMDFLFDGFMLFTMIRKGSIFEKVMSIMKMKGHKHSADLHPIIIGKGGIKIIHDQIPFALADKDSKK